MRPETLLEYPEGRPFYCGKTVHDVKFRLGNHHVTRNKYPNRPISVWLVACGEHLRIQTMEVVAANDDWYARERFWIGALRTRFPGGANISDGGAGPAGIIRSLETRAKISMSKKGGKHSLETLAKISMAQKNRKFSDEHRAKISAANSSRWQRHFAEHQISRKRTPKPPTLKTKYDLVDISYLNCRIFINQGAPMRILLVEPDAAVAQSIELMLKSESFNVYTTDLGEEAVDLGKLYDYDLITLALNLPDISGYAVLRRLRVGKIKTPVLVLSGLAGIEDKVKAFGLGADDYLTKPFHKDELVARIHAIVRRSKGHAQSVVQVGDLVVNLDNKSLSIAGKPVHLTGKEYQMMEILALRQGSLITKEMFLNHLYGGMDEPELKIIDVFICKLRKKLTNASGGRATFIETVWGRGYVLRASAEWESPSLAPEVHDMIDDPPVGFVSKTTVSDRREANRKAGLITSPSIVPERP